EPRQVGRVHLRVAGHHRHQEAWPAFPERRLVATDDGATYAAVRGVPDHPQPVTHAAAGCAQGLRGAVGRGVIHDHHAVDEARHRFQHLPDELLLVVSGHDDDDAPAFEHEPLFYLMDSERPASSSYTRRPAALAYARRTGVRRSRSSGASRPYS